ncbi:MAG: helix-turn-helix transcriptional regulator [Xanthomonadales bacterium]|nr:helix-turn-helix transcriptional regulator [Xanthomonadales bacterium]
MEEVQAEPYSTMEGHGHAGAHVCVVLAGSFDESGPKRSISRCETGMMRISPPGRRHTIHFGPEGARCLLFVMSPRWSRTTALFPNQPTPDHFSSNANLGALALNLRHQAQDKSPESALKAENMIAELLARSKTKNAPPAWLDRARDMLKRDFRESTNLSHLAEDVGVHRVHLAREFTRYFGVPAQYYQRSLRLIDAACKLADSSLPIPEVALAAGFFDQAHLGRVFRDRFGVPPAAYRRQEYLGPE